MQGCKLLFGVLFFGVVLLTSCNNKQPSEGAIISAEDTTSFASTISNFKQTFAEGNQLYSIPGIFEDYSDAQIALHKTDSIAIALLMQDGIKHHYDSEDMYQGIFLHAVIDTYTNFTLVCLEHNMGDGGDVYTLNTYTKAGIKIADILAAEMPGEESDYAFYLNSVLQNDTLIRYETHCRHSGGQDAICDSFTRYSLLNGNGIFVELKADSVLDSRLDTIRKEMFNY